MMAEAVKQDIRVLIENKAKFLLVSCMEYMICYYITLQVHSSSGHRYALKGTLLTIL